MTRKTVFWLIALIVAAIIGYYVAVFTTPANIVADGSLVIPTAYTGQRVEWNAGYQGAKPLIKFFDGEGNSPCSSPPEGDPLGCRISFGALQFYPYMLTPPGGSSTPTDKREKAPGGAAASPQIEFMRIVHCPGCPPTGTTQSLLALTGATTHVAAVCLNGKATPQPDPQPVSLSSNPVVEWVPTGSQSVAVNFTAASPCSNGSGPFGAAATCTVTGPAGSYPYTINISGTKSACSQGSGTLIVQ